MPERDPFDLDELRIDPADPDLRPGGATPRKTKWRRQFIRFPWSWMDRLRATRHCATYRLALLLIYEHWRNGGQTITLSNLATAQEGITRQRKWGGLRELEQLGLIKIERRSRKSPLVTVLADKEIMTAK
jgi:hypothetical protein